MTTEGRDELSEVKCCGGVGVQSAITSLRRRITEARQRCSTWLSSCTTRLRDAVGPTSDDRGQDLEERFWPTAAGRLMEVARPALGTCRQFVGRRLSEAYGRCRPGTARLRESMSFWRAVVAEFVGTFFLVIIGCGSATEHISYSPAQQQQQDRAVRMALAFGILCSLCSLGSRPEQETNKTCTRNQRNATCHIFCQLRLSAHKWSLTSQH